MLPDIAAYVPKAAIKAFAAIGFVIVVKFALNYVKLLLDLFVLSGTNVSLLPCCLLFTFAYVDNSYANMARKALGPLSPAHQMALAKKLPSSSPRKVSTSYSSLEPNPNYTRWPRRSRPNMSAHKSRQKCSRWTSPRTMTRIMRS